MNGVQLVGWLTDNACRAVRGRDFPQSPGVSRPLGGDRLVDDLAQPDPRLPGGGGVFAPDVLPQLWPLRVSPPAPPPVPPARRTGPSARTGRGPRTASARQRTPPDAPRARPPPRPP